MIKILEYVRNDGHCPFAEWLERLNDSVVGKIATAIERMESGNFGDHKSVGGGVMERRINFGPGYRIYFARDGDRLVILVGGGTKARQNIDIKRAQEAWSEYKANKK